MESSGCDDRERGAPEPRRDREGGVPRMRDARESRAQPRSLLFVPGDSERKLAHALDAGADALILDLEDSVAPGRKAAARGLAAEFLSEHGSKPRLELWVRINAPSSPLVHEDLAAVVAARPRGLVVPKVRAAELAALAAALDERERRHGIDVGATRLLPIATETPASVLSMGEYCCGIRIDDPRLGGPGLAGSRPGGARLAGLTWGAEDLSAALGAATAVGEDGAWLPVYELARSLCLLAARAAGVAPIDTVYTNFRDAGGLRRQAREARRDGFSGKLAIHPDQIGIIHEAFQPTAAEIDAARRVVAAFEDANDGVVALDGRMLDEPHLQHARRLLARAAQSSADIGEEL